MIEFLNKKNNYDFIHQFQWINAKNKPKLKRLYIDNINNDIISKNNLIYPTYYSLLLLFNQKPSIKTTKKSIASFNIRPNMNLGTFISISKNSYFWNKLFYLILPNLPQYKNNITYQLNNKNKNICYNIHCNYGIDNFIYKLTSPHENNLRNYNNLGGLNMIFYFTSPTLHKPFYYI